MKRIGILTSGGDCQGLNSAIRGVAKGLYEHYGKDVEIYGFLEGYAGLINKEYKQLAPADVENILDMGGTILGTSRQPYKLMTVKEGDAPTKLQQMVENYKKLKLDVLVTLGGAGTHKTASLLSVEGCNVIGLPKTIDNDIYGTDVTFGFQTAVETATECIDRIRTTAAGHGRTIIVEVMGNKAGWLALNAGIAAGADMILLPEIPYDVDKIAKVLKRRNERGSCFSILAVAEGAISKQEAAMSKKEFKAARANMAYPSISYRLAHELGEKLSQEIRVVVPGHYQRGGSPCPYDRVLTTRLGTAAAQLIIEKKYGNMVALQNGEIVPVPLKEVAGKLKTVPVDCSQVRAARSIGISFGD